MFKFLRVTNGWTLAGAVLGVIVIYNLWKNGNTTVTLATQTGNFIDNTIKALEV